MLCIEIGFAILTLLLVSQKTVIQDKNVFFLLFAEQRQNFSVMGGKSPVSSLPSYRWAPRLRSH